MDKLWCASWDVILHSKKTSAVRLCVCLQSTFSRSTFDVQERAVRVNDVPGLSKSSPDAKPALKPYNLTGEQAARGSKIKMAFSLFCHCKSIFIYLEIPPSVHSWVLQVFSNLGRFIFLRCFIRNHIRELII